jgi:hypothetical protein
MNEVKALTPEEYANRIADRLGYLKHDEALRTDWALFLLPNDPTGGTTRRSELQTPAQQSALWPVSASEKGI